MFCGDPGDPRGSGGAEGYEISSVRGWVCDECPRRSVAFVSGGDECPRNRTEPITRRMPWTYHHGIVAAGDQREPVGIRIGEANGDGTGVNRCCLSEDSDPALTPPTSCPDGCPAAVEEVGSGLDWVAGDAPRPPTGEANSKSVSRRSSMTAGAESMWSRFHKTWPAI